MIKGKESDCQEEETITDNMFWQKETKLIQVTTKIYSYMLLRVFKNLEKGGVVAVPTDTVYGLISLLENSNCLHHIKRRSPDKPLGLFINDSHDVSRYAHLTVPNTLLTSLFPGPVTLLFERNENALPAEFNPGVSTVGFRIPQNSLIRDICRHYVGRPIVQTSANVSGAPLSPLYVQDFKELHDELALIVDTGEITESDGSREGSTVVDLSVKGHYRIVRNGCALKNTESILKKFNLSALTPEVEVRQPLKQTA